MPTYYYYVVAAGQEGGGVLEQKQKRIRFVVRFVLPIHLKTTRVRVHVLLG